jgi:hypothetical protein
MDKALLYYGRTAESCARALFKEGITKGWLK